MKFVLLLLSGFWFTNGFVAKQHNGRHSADLEKIVNNYNAINEPVSISMPLTRMVYQRNNKNKAIVEVVGTIEQDAATIEARLVARAAGQGTSTKWKRIAKNVAAGDFSGTLKGTAGWYDLEVRVKNKQAVEQTARVERVGIGEVFLIAGHSVAQGGDINIEGAEDDRVNTILLDEKTPVFDKYLKTADPQYLPDPVFVKAVTGVAHAPFGHNNYFWSKFGELLAQQENVPVLIYNAGFGGTSLEHWAKSAKGLQFEHGFVRSGIRMPYINVYNALTKYIALTGFRAILADQGQNDSGQKNADSIISNYKIFIEKAREDIQYPKLALVVNRQSPKNAPAVRTAQEYMAKQPFCFAGPDYDTLLKDDTVDGIHLSKSGEQKAAMMWAASLNADFFRNSKPWIPTKK